MPESLSLIRISRPTACLAAVVDDQVVPLSDYATVDDLFREADPWAAVRRAAGQGPTIGPVEETQLEAPLYAPSKIVCVGLNYRDHAAEVGLDLPSAPLLFSKYASTLAGPAEQVRWDPDLTTQVDWEGELALVVGRTLRTAGAEEALAAVFGYTIANDLSARDLQFADGQWLRGKSLDGFCPLGPHIVPASALGDASDLAISTTVNGDVVQDSRTSQMVFGVGQILSFASRAFTLSPGDLVLTGTPAGVGMSLEPPRFLSAGDVVEVSVEGIGTLATSMGAPLTSPSRPGASQ